MAVQIAIPFRGFGLSTSSDTISPVLDTSDIVEVPGEIEVPLPEWEVDFKKEFTVTLNSSSDTLPDIKTTKWGKLVIPLRPYKRLIRLDTYVSIQLKPARYKVSETTEAIFAYKSVPTVTLYKVNTTVITTPITSVIPSEIHAPSSLIPLGVPTDVLSYSLTVHSVGQDIIKKNEQSTYYLAIDFGPIEWDNGVHPDYTTSASIPWVIDMSIEGALIAAIRGNSEIPV